MTRSEFETVYESNYTKALNAARRISYEYAEDAVADAAVYFLENLERFQQVTPSYFIQKCVNRTRDVVRNQHSDVVIPSGTTEHDLPMIEEAQVERELGRKYTPGKRAD